MLTETVFIDSHHVAIDFARQLPSRCGRECADGASRSPTVRQRRATENSL
jgi:hypothetical protein